MLQGIKSVRAQVRIRIGVGWPARTVRLFSSFRRFIRSGVVRRKTGLVFSKSTQVFENTRPVGRYGKKQCSDRSVWRKNVTFAPEKTIG